MGHVESGTHVARALAFPNPERAAEACGRAATRSVVVDAHHTAEALHGTDRVQSSAGIEAYASTSDGMMDDPGERAGDVIPLHGPVEVDCHELAAVKSRVLGAEITYAPISIERFRHDMEHAHGFHPFLVQHLEEVAKDSRDGLFSGVNDAVAAITGRPPSSMSEVVERNLASNLALAGRHPRRPLLWLVASKLTFGLGVLLMPFAPDHLWLMAFAALAAVNGPFENVALLHVIQSDFTPERIAPVYRVQMCAVFGGLLLGHSAAPSLFGFLGLGPTISLIGGVTFAMGLIGLGLAWVLASRQKDVQRYGSLAR